MQTNYTPNDIARFWGKVDKESSSIFYNGTRCWEWNGSRHGKGYGHLQVGRSNHKAHRVSYVVAFGNIPQGLQALHHCDNPPCTNPDHLFLGTNQDNVSDKVRKGRQARSGPTSPARGESNGKHKLTNAQIEDIRRRYAYKGIGGEDTYQLAKAFGVHSSHISRIVNGKRC